MLFTNNFEYDGIRSAKYGLFFGHVDTERLKKICGDIEYKQSYYPSLNRQEIHGTSKDEFPLSFELEIISAEPISYRSAKEIKKWLFNSPTYKKLYASRIKDKTIEKINGVEKRRYVECVFTNPEAMFYADGLHGWKCTCTLSSGWSFQDEIEITYTDFSGDIVIPVDSDNGEYIYPTMVISVAATTNPISPAIVNTSDNNRKMEIKDIPAQTEIYVDSAVGTITDNTATSLYPNLVDQKFLRLVNGDNVLQVSGISELTIRYQNVRYIL